MEKQKFPIKAFIRIKPTLITTNGNRLKKEIKFSESEQQEFKSLGSKHPESNSPLKIQNQAPSNPHKTNLISTHFLNNNIEYTKTTLKIKSTTTQKEYTFDKIFGPKSTQLCIFNNIKDALKTFRQGYNVTIFCYGNTGAGKTHTMIGTKQSPGLIYNILKDLLLDMEIDVSYLEIYNEKIFDLLEPKQLILRECENTVIVPELFNKKISNYSEFIEIFEKGNLNRRTGETKLNKSSSRSHSILRLMNNGTKFYLVDLAGSENNRKTGNTGIRLTESNNINKSLFVLGNVVNSILKNDKRIPYRDSKLTRLLQDSIGGNSLCYVIANIIDDVEYLDETLNTLKFACKSRKIVNVPRIAIEDTNSNKPNYKDVYKKTEFHNRINSRYVCSGRDKFLNSDNKNLINKNTTQLKFNEKNIKKSNITENILTDKTNTPKKQKICDIKNAGRLSNKDTIFNGGVITKILNDKNLKKELNDKNLKKELNDKNLTESNDTNLLYNKKNTKKKKEDSTFIFKSSLINNPDLLLTPTTQEKSYKAFLKRAQNSELEGNYKSALEDYKILKKIRDTDLVNEKIQEITKLIKKQKIKKSFSSPREVLDILNSGNFVSIKQINGIGDKRAESVLEFLDGGNFFENLDDLKLLFSEKVVCAILNCIDK